MILMSEIPILGPRHVSKVSMCVCVVMLFIGSNVDIKYGSGLIQLIQGRFIFNISVSDLIWGLFYTKFFIGKHLSLWHFVLQ